MAFGKHRYTSIRNRNVLGSIKTQERNLLSHGINCLALVDTVKQFPKMDVTIYIPNRESSASDISSNWYQSSFLFTVILEDVKYQEL